MKIGIISDTHVRKFEALPENLIAALSKVDLIIHAGDVVTADVIDGLKSLAPFEGVYGNMDLPEVKSILPRERVLEIKGRRIGIIHGSGGPWMLEERVMQAFNDVDVIIFGHSHQTFNRVIDGILLFNPGTAAHSYGILDIDDTIKSKIFTDYY